MGQVIFCFITSSERGGSRKNEANLAKRIPRWISVMGYVFTSRQSTKWTEEECKDRSFKRQTDLEHPPKTSVQFSCSVVSNSLRPHGLQHTRLLCPPPTPRAYSNSCPLSQWCHPTISSSVIPFSFCLQSFPASGSFQMNQFFSSGGQNIGVSASALVLPMNIQDWFPLGLTGWISLPEKMKIDNLLRSSWNVKI